MLKAPSAVAEAVTAFVASATAVDTLVFAALRRFLAEASLPTSALEMMSQDEAADGAVLVALLDEDCVGTAGVNVHEQVLASSSDSR